MRTARVLGVFLVLFGGKLAAQTPTPAQGVPYYAEVTAEKAEVRSGPSDSPQMYPTGELRRGDLVEVLEARPDGWLAIKPPRGSFSWIEYLFVEPTGPQTWVVRHAGGKVPVRVGSWLLNSEPTVEQVQVERGTQVVSVDQVKRQGDGRKWVPIEPPPGERRYVHTRLVQRVSTDKATAALKAAHPAPAPVKPAATSTDLWRPSNPATPGVVVPTPAAPVAPTAAATSQAPGSLQQRAEDAELRGQTAEALRLYRELLSAPAVDNGTRLTAQNRIATLERATPARPNTAPTPSREVTYTGWVRNTSIGLNGMPGFALCENRTGAVIVYLASPTVALRDLTNRYVEVTGTMATATDRRGNHPYLQVTSVTVGRARP